MVIFIPQNIIMGKQLIHLRGWDFSCHNLRLTILSHNLYVGVEDRTNDIELLMIASDSMVKSRMYNTQ